MSRRIVMAINTCAILLVWGVLCMSATAQNNMTGLLEHPCVLVNAEMLPALRTMATDTEPNKFGFSTAEVWQGLLAQADRYLDAPPYHYQVNMPQKGGKPSVPWEYTLSDATPPPHDDVPAYPPWTAMTQEQRADAITVRLKALAAAYLITGEKKYADRAKKIAMHLTHWDYWTDRSYTAGRTKACLDTGHLTKCVGLFYDWCYDMLSADERATIRAAIIDKGIKMILADVDRYPPETNGYAVLTAGLACAALAVRPEEPQAGEWLSAAIDKTKKSLNMSGKDGGLFEGPGYGTYLLDNFAHVLDAVTAAQIETDLFEHSFLATMTTYTISHMTPDGHVMPCFGDGSPTTGYPETMSILANRGSTEAAWYLQQTAQIKPTTLHQFLRFNAESINPLLPTFNPSRPFVDIGYAILRDGYKPHTPYLAFKSGPFDNSIGHNHYDHNSFVISYLGDWLITDRGYSHAYHPAIYKFSQGTIGHASVVLDIDDGYMADTACPAPGHDQVRNTGGRITKFFSCEAFDYVQGQAAPAYNTKDHTVLDDFTRNIFYFKPHFFVMLDHLETPEPHSYNVLLQAGPSSICKRLAADQWLISGQSAELSCWLYGSQPITTAAQLYPGAEKYGQFLRAYTQNTHAADFITVMAPRPFHTRSLVRNEGFEQGMLGWSPRANEDLPNHVIDTEAFRSGKASGRIDKSGYYYSPRLPMSPGTKLKASVWVKTKATSGGAYLTLYYYGPKKCFDQVPTNRTISEDWTKLEVAGVAPAGTERVCIGLNFFGEGKAWFDDVVFEKDEATTDIPPLAEFPEIQALPDGRGINAQLGDTQFLLLTSGGPVTAGKPVYAHDGTFAAICRTGCWDYLYLQEGTSLQGGDNQLIATDRDQPMTVAVWRGEGEDVHLAMTADTTPHAEPVPPNEVKLRIFSSRPISRAFCAGRQLPLNVAGNIYTIGK
jgi:hypothetical protein